MRKQLILTIVLVGITLMSCSKDVLSDFNSDPVYTFNYSHFDSAAFGNFNLPVYENFIYKDSALGDFDTLKFIPGIIGSSLSSLPLSTKQTYIDSYFFGFYKNAILESTNQWFSGSISCDLNTSSKEVMFDSTLDCLDGSTGLPCFWYPFTSSGLKIYKSIPSITIEGTTYTNVHSFFASNGQDSNSEAYQAVSFYWANDIGIIKRTTWTGTAVKTSLLIKYW